MKKSVYFFALLALAVGCKKQNDDANAASENQTKATAAINAGTVQQSIKGFGGANIVAWTGDLTSAQRTTAFSPSSGIGLSIVRVRVPNTSSEFAREKATIDACKAQGGSAIATAWSAPASMKTNGSTTGGKIKTASYAAYAAHLKAFNDAVGGVSAISPANEPDYKVDYESMELTAAEVADFVAAQGQNCGAPIMAPESFSFNQTYTNNYLSNATAKSKTSFVCGHIYGRTPYVSSFGKPTWMTEHYVNSSKSGNDWPTAIAAAKEIHDCMNVGWSAYVWWYIRRSYGPIDENGNITKTGYVMANYARYVRPGYNKISCTSNPSTGIFVTAYKNSSNKIVIVIINQNSATTYQDFSLSGVTKTSFSRYTTNASSNLASSSFTISGSTFGINVPGSSVVTLVSN